MVKRVAYISLAALYFGSAPFLHRLGALPAALLTVALAASLAVLASGTADALAVALGAGAAFAGTTLGGVSAPIGAAVLVALVFGERTVRVRTPRAQVAHVLLALGSGAAAGLVGQAYRGASGPTFGVAALVAAVLVAAPFLIDADDAVAYALDRAAVEAGGAIAPLLTRAAELRRASREVPLDRGTEREIEATWRALTGLSAARLRLERRDRSASPAAASVLAKLDARIAQHVDVLARAYTAIDAASAARVGDDRALTRVAEEHDALSEEARALAEIEAELAREAPAVLSAK